MAADATKLESINDMLQTSGYMRETALPSTRTEVIAAEVLLDSVDRNIQMEGWHFNSQYNQTFSPNAGNEVDLDADIFEVNESSGNDSPIRRDPMSPTDLAKRGLRLYNAETDSYTFESDVLLNVIRQVAFTDLPQYARAFIVARASRMFYANNRGRDLPSAQEFEMRARASFMASENRNASFNMFNGPDTNWVDYRR